MKRINYLFVLLGFLVLSTIAVSCGRKEKTEVADNQLGKMEVVIPDELKDNPELVEYIEGMTEVFDEYALLLDGMMKELGEFSGKTIDELNMREKIKMTATGAELAVKSAPILVKWGELQAKSSYMDEQLTDEEVIALESVMDRFEARMAQIEEKHQKVFEGASDDI